jgi:hypothetical protein
MRPTPISGVGLFRLKVNVNIGFSISAYKLEGISPESPTKLKF